MSDPTVPSTPTGNNASAAQGQSFVESFEPYVEKVADTLIETQLPVLQTPVVKQLFEEMVHLVTQAEFKQIALMVTFVIIDGQILHEKTDFSVALAALRTAQVSGDPNAVITALKNFQIAAQNLGHADGSASNV